VEEIEFEEQTTWQRVKQRRHILTMLPKCNNSRLARPGHGQARAVNFDDVYK